MIKPLFLLLAGHFLADFPLQDDHMAKTKNRNRKVDLSLIPEGQTPTPIWFYSLTAHAMIHGLVSYTVTGSLTIGLIETLAHGAIDFMKCENWTNPHIDQALHYLCKLAYVMFLYTG